MASKDLDFNFDGLFKTETNEPVETKKKQIEKPFDINLAITISPGVYLLKDLAHMTGEEFLQWKQQVYPIPDVYTARDFDSRSNKYRAFQNITRWHKDFSFPPTKHKNENDIKPN